MQLLSLIFIIMLFSACGSVPVVSQKDRGLFQKKTEFAPVELPSRELSDATMDLSETGFIWPLKVGTISSLYGQRRRDFHDGVDIKAPRGTHVLAAKEGEVVYSSRKIKGYGNLIVIKHPDSTATVYAHNQKNLVKKGQKISQGELIALVGATGKATGPHLHFEIRKGEAAEDPLLYLPPLRAPAHARR